MPDRYEITEVKASDVDALKLWAEDWCRGAKVRDLAAALGVEGTKAAIADYLSEGLTNDAKQVVMGVCERELIESDLPG